MSTFGITKPNPSYTFWLGVLDGTVFIGAALGAIIFGILANKGRKTFYGVDVALMTMISPYPSPKNFILSFKAVFPELLPSIFLPLTIN
jgi:hypothetical protein